MKATFINEVYKKEIFLKMYFNITEELYMEEYSYINEVYEGLKDYPRTKLVPIIVKHEVEYGIESVLDDYLSFTAFFNIDWSEEIKDFLDMYFYDIIKEIEKCKQSWD